MIGSAVTARLVQSGSFVTAAAQGDGPDISRLGADCILFLDLITMKRPEEWGSPGANDIHHSGEKDDKRMLYAK